MKAQVDEDGLYWKIAVMLACIKLFGLNKFSTVILAANSPLQIVTGE